MNVSRLVTRQARENPEKTAICFEETTISYGDLERFVDRAAAGFLKMGLNRGDVLSLFLPSLPELIIAYLGTVRAGLTVNVVNAMLQPAEVSYILKDCGSRALLLDGRRLPILEAVREEIPSLEQVLLLEEGHADYRSFRTQIRDEGEGPETEETKGSDLCHLMYTSGTTGWPKGVMATHLNVWHNATEFGKVHFLEEDRVMVATPIFHCWGLVNGTFGTFSRGGTVITVERFHPATAMDTIERLRPTVFQGVPPMYNLLLKQPDLDKRDLSSVKFCLSAATKMPETLIREVTSRLAWRYAEAWGLTEVSCVGSTAHHTETRIGSCGKGMADAMLKVIDEKGRTLPPGERGELCVRGTCVTLGYLNRSDATRQAFDGEGWFHSGDIAFLDSDGFAYIVDRKKDMINVGGEKVFPSEVEDLMLSNPKIKDLVIVGIQDELRGEAPKAYIQLKEGEEATEEEIRAYCRGRMAPYKIPIAVAFVSEIPRLASGKALRRQLRESA